MSTHTRPEPKAREGSPLRRRTFLFSALASGLLGIPVRAQTVWPVHTARFIVPFAAGSAIDVPARMIADRLAVFILQMKRSADRSYGRSDRRT